MSFTRKQYADMAVMANQQGKILQIINGELVLTEHPAIEKTFSDVQQERILFFGKEFAKRRDAITWAVQTDGSVFGYDRKSEDVTNFLAAMKRAELGLDTGFNVYVGSADEPKQFLPHTYKMFQDVLEQSAQEQITAYLRYEAIKKQILDECSTVDELNAITW